MGNNTEEANEAQRQIQVSWHALALDETVSTLKCDKSLTSKELSSADVAHHKEFYGLNKITEPEKETLWQKNLEASCKCTCINSCCRCNCFCSPSNRVNDIG